MVDKIFAGNLRGFISDILDGEGNVEISVSSPSPPPTPAATVSATSASTISYTSAVIDGSVASVIPPTSAPTGLPIANSGRSGSSSSFNLGSAADVSASNDVSDNNVILFRPGSGRKLRQDTEVSSSAPTLRATAASTMSETRTGRTGSSSTPSSKAADVSASNDVSNSETVFFGSESTRKRQLQTSNDFNISNGRDAFTSESSIFVFSPPTMSPTVAFTMSSTNAETEAGASARAAATTPIETSGLPGDVAASNDVGTSNTFLFESGSERKLQWGRSNDVIRQNVFSFESAPLIVSGPLMSPTSAPTSAAEVDDAIKLLSTDVTDDFLLSTTDIATMSVTNSEQGTKISASNDGLFYP